MRLASLLPVLLVTAGCVIVVDDDDDRPGRPPRVDAGAWPDARLPVDAGAPDARTADGGSPEVLTIELDCAPAETLTPQSLAIAGDTAVIEVEHGGGCGDHAYRVCWDGAFLESWPVQAKLTVQHRSDDPCDALLRRTLTIDLARLRDAYRQRYQTPSGEILVGFRPAGPSGRYTF